MKFKLFNTCLLLKLLFLILINIQSISCLTVSGNTIYDLEWTGSSFINNEVPYWSASWLRSSYKYSVCNGAYLLGGFGVLGGTKGEYFSRTYSSLPSHNQLYFTMMFYPIDSWDGNAVDDHFEISFDGNVKYAWKLSAFAGYTEDVCGGSWGEFPPLKVKITYPHTSSSINIKVINQLDQDSEDESMGFREVTLTFQTVSSPSYTICGTADRTPLPDKWCSCATGTEYMNPVNSGNCFPCDSTCKTCNGGAATNCLSCYDGRYLNGVQCSVCNSICKTCYGGGASNCLTCPTGKYMINGNSCVDTCDLPLQVYDNGTVVHCLNPCTTAGQYTLWDGECSAVCSAIFLTPRTYNTFSLCDYPCGNTQYLYWDGACDDTCFFPKVIRSFHGKFYCDFPCSTSQYLYWNNTCLSTCSAPLISRVERGMKYCDYPCSGTEYLYWNGSCIATCNSPLSPRIDAGNRYCDFSCTDTTLYLYWSGLCSGSCAYPLTAVSEGSPMVRKYCRYPCTTSQYLYWNASCIGACNFPLSTSVFQNRNFCNYPCSASYYLYWDGSCQSSCPFPLSTRVEASLNYCDYPCTGTNYLYWNGSCISACSSPLTSRNTGGKLYCDYPCYSYDYLYWNGSCKGSCSFPLVTRVEASLNYCDYPCTGSNYLYWNRSCIASCNSPLTPRTTDGNYYCDFTCSSSQYLYWDKACSATCGFPLVAKSEGSPVRYFCTYPCTTTEYLYWNGTCAAACDFPLSPRTQNSRNFCSMPCTNPSDYLYWNGSCISTCPSPLSTRIESTQKYCDYPCSATQYLYWNGSCMASCNAPLDGQLVDGNYFCYYPCNSALYLYWDGSCGASCPSPRKSVSEGTPVRNYCIFQCTSSEYLYWNGSCISGCAYPLSQYYQNSRYFCDYPCATNQYLFWNASCLSTCPTPHVTKVEASRNYCIYPCTAGQYLYWNGSCISSCPSALTIRYEASKYYCDYKCPIAQYLYWNGSCLNGCSFPLSTRIEASRNYCDYPCLNSEYLYWNGSCKATCPSPLLVRIDAGNKYCDYKCQSNQILYWDGTCTSDCPAPRTLVTEGSPARNYCTFSCSSSQYLYWNGTCSSTCKAPLVGKAINSKLFCQYPCSATDYLYWNGTCSSSCPIPYVSRIESSLNYCEYPCSNSQFLYWNGTCSSTCNAPLLPKINGTFKSCEFQCDPNDFLYWDGTCSQTCPLPLTGVYEGSVLVRKYCTYKCQSNEFLYWNGSCLSTCNSPLTIQQQNGQKICNFGCDPSQYLYWDGTCSFSCPSPLVLKIESNLKYCTTPCSSSQFLFWNGSCISSCNNGFKTKTQKGVHYCEYPCEESDYLYFNNTCSSRCPSPLIERVEGNVKSRKYCSFPCASNEFLDWNNTCQSSCDPPYISSISSAGRSCSLPCSNSSDFYYAELEACKSGCESPYTIDRSGPYPKCVAPTSSSSTSEENGGVVTTGGTLFNAFLVAPAQAGTLTLVKVVKPMQYLRYLDIKLPPRLARLGTSQGRGIMTLQSTSRRLEKVDTSGLMKGSLPSVFTKHNLDTSFVVNFWGTFIFILVALGLAIVFYLLEKISKKMQWELFEAIFKRFRVITKWNLVVMLIATSIDDIILYTSLELRALNFSDAYASDYLSLAISIIFVILEVIVLIGSFLLVRNQRKMKKSVFPNKSNLAITSYETKWQDFQVVFRGFNDNKSLNPYFYLVYMMRIGFPMLITVCAVGAPMVVMITQVAASVLIILYLLIMKPFIKRINQIQVLIFELVVLMLNICMFMLTIFSVFALSADDVSVVLGDIVIIGNDCLNLLLPIFFVIRCVKEGMAIYRYNKADQSKKKVEKVQYLQLVALLFQQTNMGFEELIEDYSIQALPLAKIVKKEFDSKSLVTEKLELNKNESYSSPEKTLGQPDDKVFLVNDEGNKEDNWATSIAGGYKGNISESMLISNVETIKITNNDPEVGLKPRGSGYQRLNSSSTPTSPIRMKNKKESEVKVSETGDVKIFDFDNNASPSETPSFNTKVILTFETKVNASEKKLGEGKAVVQNVESGTLNELRLTEKRSTSTTTIKENKEDKPLQKIEEEKLDAEDAQPKVQPKSYYAPTIIKPAQPVVAEKAKKFLNYNWADVGAVSNSNELTSSPTKTLKLDTQEIDSPLRKSETKLLKEEEKDESQSPKSPLKKLDTFEWNSSKSKSPEKTLTKAKTLGKSKLK